MTRMFRIEDELHSEPVDGEFPSFELALSEVRRLAGIPWGEEPNVAPCQSWRTCGRHYEIVEYETPSWTERERTPIVEIMSDGVEWEYTGAQDAA
jgi:hypothetical protein